MIEAAALLSAGVRSGPTIILVLLFNAGVGFWREYQTSNAIEELKKRLALRARVRRHGQWQTIEARELVPGDLIRLRLGDMVPADARLLTGTFLSVDQSAPILPVEKGAKAKPSFPEHRSAKAR